MPEDPKANVQRTFAGRVLWCPAPIPYRKGFDNRPLPGSFGKAEDGDEGQSEMFGD